MPSYLTRYVAILQIDSLYSHALKTHVPYTRIIHPRERSLRLGLIYSLYIILIYGYVKIVVIYTMVIHQAVNLLS